MRSFLQPECGLPSRNIWTIQSMYDLSSGMHRQDNPKPCFGGEDWPNIWNSNSCRFFGLAAPDYIFHVSERLKSWNMICKDIHQYSILSNQLGFQKTHRNQIEARDSRTGYLIWARGLAKWNNRRCIVATIGVIWEITKYKEMYTFSKMGMSQIP